MVSTTKGHKQSLYLHACAGAPYTKKVCLLKMAPSLLCLLKIGTLSASASL